MAAFSFILILSIVPIWFRTIQSSKDKIITLRLNGDDLEQIKSIANSEGISYQTLISGILHKYINNRFVDKKEALKISELLKNEW